MNDSNMQLYKVFNEVAKVGNITHAAKRLYISQPAVSNAINNLENNLGVSLFTRKSRGVELTEDGELLYRHVKSAYDILEKGEFELQQSKKMKVGRISIGMSTTMCHFVIRTFLKEFMERHPYIEMSLMNQSSHQTFSMLENHGLDIGITTEPIKKTAINYEPFMQYKYTFVTTESYINKMKLREAKNMEDLLQWGTMMVLVKRHPLRESMDQFFFEKGYKLGQILEVSNMDLLIDFAKMGMGIGYVIRNFVEEDIKAGRLRELPLDVPKDSHTFGIALNKNAVMTESMSTFLKEFHERYPLLKS